MAFDNVKFSDLSDKRKATVRETIAKMWADGYKTNEIAKKVKISKRSVATSIGNFERLVSKPQPKSKQVK